MTKAQAIKIKELSKVLTAVRERCLDCSAYSVYEVKICHLKKCSLYPFRLGVLPKNKNFTKGNNESRAKNSSLAKYTEKDIPSDSNFSKPNCEKKDFSEKPTDYVGSHNQDNKVGEFK